MFWFKIGSKKVDTLVAVKEIEPERKIKDDIATPEKKVQDDIVVLEKLMAEDALGILRKNIEAHVSSLINRMGEVKSLLLVPQPMQDEKEKLEGMRRTLENELGWAHKRLEKVIKAFELDYSPIDPNKDWHCGFISQQAIARSQLHSYDLTKISNLFPSKNSKEDKSFVFCGVVPLHIQTAYLKAKEIFGEDYIRIYSPDPQDFRKANLHPDPLMIGMIENAPGVGNLFFLIAVWDLKKDLKGITN